MKRDERRAATRQALADAALRLFLDRGVDGTTVEDIASAAGVSPRTFFLHFPAKAAAVFPDHEQNLARFRAALAGLPAGGDPVIAVCRLLVDSIRWQQPSEFRRRRYGLVAASAPIREVDARNDRDYEDAISEHLLDRLGRSPESVLAAEAVANVVVGVARAALLSWGRDGLDPAGSASRLLDRLVSSPLGGVPADLRPGRLHPPTATMDSEPVG
jgi:AcrR family transcriptional regulator